MKRIACIFVLALGLSGCGQWRQTWDYLTSVQVTPQSVAIAGNSFDALEATATNYLRLAKCTGNNGPVCRDPVATKKIINAVRSGRVARANLEQFFHDHPGQLGPTGLYDALSTSISTIQTALAGAH